jgi:UDP-N-acetylmuramate dehydrogenase
MIKPKENVQLKDYTTLKIGGNAKYFLTVSSVAEIKNVLQFIKKNDLKVFVLGSGSNLLIDEKGFDGFVIKTSRLKGINISNKKIVCCAGERLNDLVLFCAKHGLSCVERLFGIPGTVGGAVTNNAGAFGDDICSFVEQVKLVNKDGNIETLKKAEISYSYRETNLKGRGIIFEVSFAFKKTEPKKILDVIEQVKQKRKNTQPYDFPSAGSIFKNPPLDSAGKLIEMAGLKGFQVGDAHVSVKHANFIINRGKASFKDVVALIDLIKKKIKEKFNVDLELEIEVISNN